jgi:putative transposase
VKYKLKVHHFILMINHYHMVAQTEDENLDRAMQYFNSQVATRFNKLYGRSGHLWGGRYHCSILDTEGAYDRAVCYLYRNAHRAGYRGKALVDELKRYSTFSFYAFGERVDVTVTPDGMFLRLSSDVREARRQFIEMIMHAIDDEGDRELRQALRHPVCGSQKFLDRMKAHFGDRLCLTRVKPLKAPKRSHPKHSS